MAKKNEELSREYLKQLNEKFPKAYYTNQKYTNPFHAKIEEYTSTTSSSKFKDEKILEKHKKLKRSLLKIKKLCSD